MDVMIYFTLFKVILGTGLHMHFYYVCFCFLFFFLSYVYIYMYIYIYIYIYIYVCVCVCTHGITGLNSLWLCELQPSTCRYFHYRVTIFLIHDLCSTPHSSSSIGALCPGSVEMGWGTEDLPTTPKPTADPCSSYRREDSGKLTLKVECNDRKITNASLWFRTSKVSR